KNIFLDRRNALGPVYLSLIFLFIRNLNFNSKNVTLLLTSSLLLVFPILTIFQNNKFSDWSSLLSWDNVSYEIFNHFQDINYDAWSNINAGIEFAQVSGFGLGKQLVGTLFFFVPREIWPTKPVA